MVWKGSAAWERQGYTKLVLTEVAEDKEGSERTKRKGRGFVITQNGGDHTRYFCYWIHAHKNLQSTRNERGFKTAIFTSEMDIFMIIIIKMVF